MLRLISTVLCCLFLLPQATAAADANTDLRFREDGTFTVMLLADAQDTQFPPAYLLRSIEAVLNNYDIDLVVLLGDQLEGSSPVMRLGSDRDNVERALHYILDPIRDAGLPFAFVLGNHDYDAPLPPAQQLAIYQSFDNCVAPAFDVGEAYCLPVCAHDGSKPRLQLYFFDSGADSATGYGAVSREQIDWYVSRGDTLYDAADNQTTPAVSFQHVPVAEIYELFDEVPAGTAGALTRGGKSYLPNSRRMLIGEALETPCPSVENHGLFDAFIAQGDVFLAVSGHDHVNSFIGSYNGVDLCAVPGASYTSYGDPAVRGVRLLRFYEDDVKSYNTIHVRFTDFIQVGGFSAVRYYLSTTTRIPNAVKTFGLGLLLLAAAILIICLLIRARHRPKPSPEPGADTGYDDDTDAEDGAEDCTR